MQKPVIHKPIIHKPPVHEQQVQEQQIQESREPAGLVEAFEVRRRELDPLPQAELWLVDGYNALHCAPFRRGTQRDEPNFATTAASDSGYSSVTDRTDQPKATHEASLQPFWSSAMRERLVAFARRFPDPDAEIWLIFDGHRAPENPERGNQPQVRLHFAPSADDWIVDRVRAEQDSSRIAVVSGDRRLAGRSRHHGASIVSPRLFLKHCV